MSNLNQFLGGTRPPVSIVNGSSAGGVLAYVTAGYPNDQRLILSGALTATVLKTLLSITGAGAIKALALGMLDTTTRTLRLKVTIDGVVVYDATSPAIANTVYGLTAVGMYNTTLNSILDSVAFSTSLLVEVASSLTETDKLELRTIYETR